MQKEQQPGTGANRQGGSIIKSYGIAISDAIAGGSEAQDHQQ
jgi:hypothetical protein